MNITSSSAVSSANSLWNLLASRAASAASKATSTTSTSSSSSSDGATSSTASARPEGPPPPPSQFDCAMSTAQFAGMGPPPGGDPIASLDADDDGSVSADEFGLTDASDDVKNLFSAIDADGSGSLSTDEIDGFREQMMAADGGHPPGPPPGAGASGDASGGSDASASSGMPDVSSFLKQLAERYASLSGSSETTTALSATA